MRTTILAVLFASVAACGGSRQNTPATTGGATSNSVSGAGETGTVPADNGVSASGPATPAPGGATGTAPGTTTGTQSPPPPQQPAPQQPTPQQTPPTPPPANPMPTSPTGAPNR